MAVVFKRSLLVCVATILIGALWVQPVVRAGEISNPAPEDQEKIYSRKDAYRASTGRIILHYGEGMKRVINIAEILSERGYPTVAYPGGPESGVALFVGRGIGKRIYDQDDIDDGTLGGHAMTIYKDRIGQSHALPTGNAALN